MIDTAFITFEGIEGCGKSTQVKMAEEYLKSAGVPVFSTFEPTKEAKEIRERLQNENKISDKARWFLRAFIEDRRKHVREVIKPKLEQGINVLCDRYDLSTYFYQHLQGIPMDEIEREHEGILLPHKYLVYDCPAEIAFNRVKARKGKRELFDNIDVMEELRQAYLNSGRKFPERDIVVLDGSTSQELVFRQTIACLEPMFGYDLHRK